MGNCSFKDTTGESHHSIRILSDSGTILQFKPPKTAAQVLQNYPGYGVFRQGHASSPLPEQQTLNYGLFYYLLPLKHAGCKNGVFTEQGSEAEWKNENDHQVQLQQLNNSACDYVDKLSNGSAMEVLPTAKNGVWRVKLVIETRQLEEILSEQGNTEALIEKMRMAAATTSSPTRSRTMSMSTWKIGWKPTLFNALWAPVNSVKISKTSSNSDLGSC